MTAICQAGSRNEGKNQDRCRYCKQGYVEEKWMRKTNKWMMAMSVLMLETEKALGAYKHGRGTVFPVESSADRRQTHEKDVARQMAERKEL